jgi:hypothetical protein
MGKTNEQQRHFNFLPPSNNGMSSLHFSSANPARDRLSYAYAP